MAQKVSVALEDDLDAVQRWKPCGPGLGGAEYEIDSEQEECPRLRKGLSQFVERTPARQDGFSCPAGGSHASQLKKRSGRHPGLGEGAGNCAERARSHPASVVSMKPPPTGAAETMLTGSHRRRRRLPRSPFSAHTRTPGSQTSERGGVSGPARAFSRKADGRNVARAVGCGRQSVRRRAGLAIAAERGRRGGRCQVRRRRRRLRRGRAGYGQDARVLDGRLAEVELGGDLVRHALGHQADVDARAAERLSRGVSGWARATAGPRSAAG